MKYGGISRLLSKFVPYFDPQHMWKSPTRKQKLLLQRVNQIFPHHEIRKNFRHPDMRFKETNKMMELDVYVPALALAFEYQGEMHYKTEHFKHGTTDRLKARDQEKQLAAKECGITLIEVPYSWDSSKESVIKSVAKIRRDLCK